MEVMLHRESETLKQHFESVPEYSIEATFAAIDQGNLQFIDMVSFLQFFKRTGLKKITEEEVAALIRRMDTDGDKDHRIKPAEFENFIIPQEPYSKMLIRNQQKKEEDFGESPKKVKAGEEKDLKKIKVHNNIESNKLNQN